MKPRSPLPWELKLDDITSPMDSAHGLGDRARRCRSIRAIGGPVVAYDVAAANAEYIVHAAKPTRS
jgi:hypothetical protein